MREGFSQWLTGELDKRSWTKRELSERSGVSESIIYMILGERRSPGFEFCVAVAGALEIRPVVVLRQAGLLPPEAPEVEEEDELLSTFRRLSPAAREVVLGLSASMLRMENKGGQLVEVGIDYSEEPPRTTTGRLGRALAEDLETMHPEDQERVFRLMDRLRRKNQVGP